MARRQTRRRARKEVTVPPQAFSIEITKQGWLEAEAEAEADRGSAKADLCSHGDVRLTIAGQVIAPGDGRGEYGISEGALALLRTLKSDHSADAPWGSERRVAQRLIPHGCGAMLMVTCPIGIEWSVSHVGGRVRISDVRRYDAASEEEPACFPELATDVSEDEYRRQVVAFAKKAKELFEGVEKTFSDDSDRQDYEDFWEEYDRLLARAEA